MHDISQQNGVAVEIRDLVYQYHESDRAALNGLSLTVRVGERVGIAGPNGAGKSTLLTHLNGVKQGRGEIRILGRAVTKENLRFIRKNVGLVFQDPDDQLFCPTVYEDVAFGPLNMGLREDEIDVKVRDALEAVEMAGYEDKSAFHLSYGEKKRISIATVLSMEPEILVFDEPSTNLDPRLRRRLIERLRQFKHTLLIASHDLDMLLDLCERVVIINEGRVVADGPAEGILTDRAVLEANNLELPLSMQRRNHYD